MESEMALSFERTRQCAQKPLGTADNVRATIYRQLGIRREIVPPVPVLLDFNSLDRDRLTHRERSNSACSRCF